MLNRCAYPDAKDVLAAEPCCKVAADDLAAEVAVEERPKDSAWCEASMTWRQHGMVASVVRPQFGQQFGQQCCAEKA